MNPEQLWQTTLGELELMISKANFTTWFKNTYVASWEKSKIIIGVPNTFTKAWLEKKYHGYIYKALQNSSKGEIKEIIYKVEIKKPQNNILVNNSSVVTNSVSVSESGVQLNNFGLNNYYTFNKFIVGKGNELAHAAAQAVARQPGSLYNPFFIYGGVGLGKTHLLQAIGHQITENYKDKKILYITCERFTNDFVQSIRNGTSLEFQGKYRGVDVLLIDDIQFMAGKEQTQEQFFHTFNALHQNGKQIIISSDRPPKAIPSLENRLLSRFEWGMIADIGQPDFETRIAILEAKLAEKGLDIELGRDIINYIATNVQNNIRELEGSLNRILAIYELNKKIPTIDEVKIIINSLNTRAKKTAITCKYLIKTVADFYELNIDDLIGESRKKELVFPRQISMFLIREEIKSSFPNIGQEMGGRDHTTAMHAYSKISKELESNQKLQQDINLIKEKLYSNC